MSFLINPFTFAVAGGDYEAISSVTVGSGGASSIEFTSIPSTFAHLQVRGIVQERVNSGGPGAIYVLVRLNSDGAGGQYPAHHLVGTGSAVSSSSIVGAAYTYAYIARGYYTSTASDIFGAVVIDVLDYANTSKNTTLRSFSGHDANGDGHAAIASSLWLSTSAVSSLVIYPNVPVGSGINLAEGTTFALYGVKAP